MRGRGVFLNRRSRDNLFLNRMITPVEDAAGGEADKTRGRRVRQHPIKKKDHPFRYIQGF